MRVMGAGSNEWERVDTTGCFPWVLRAMLLAWSVVLPYAVITGNKGWFVWSAACVLAGVWLTLRQRSQRAFEIPDMAVDVSPNDLHPGDQFLVTLKVGGEKARTIRWWSAEMMADVEGDDPRVMVNAEFAIDPEADMSPVSELQMVLEAPSLSAVRDANRSDWWVRVTVETDRGRMESGRVAVRVVA
jgi:hypothetical protein